MQILREILYVLNEGRLKLGRFIGLLGMAVLSLTMLLFLVVVLAIVIDLTVYTNTGSSLGLSKPFMSGIYRASDTGFEGIASLLLIGLVTGGLIFGLGKLIAIGDYERW